MDIFSKEAFEQRRLKFLNFIVTNSSYSEETIWGPYRLVDGYALAHLALEENLQRACQLIEETLDLVQYHVEQEKVDPKKKWHLLDFALHPLLRAYLLYPNKFFNSGGDKLWRRLVETLQHYPYHFGDLTENHNLLHLALRYLVAQTWPNVTFADGRSSLTHLTEAYDGLLTWMDSWITQGSVEWGSEIYYNINLLALLNLYDFAQDETMRRVATGLLDLFLFDEALDAFSEGFVGASRRSYGAYRLDTNESPSRDLHFLYFGIGDDTLNLNYVGGVIEAATSRYRPPETIINIATDRMNTFVTHTTHKKNSWADAAHLSKTTLRTPHVMLSTMNSPGGPYRYTEVVWQATFDPQTLVFANHPTLHRRAFSNHPGTPQDILNFYESARPDPKHPYWTLGNVPPGHYGDTRPGFWQGNSWGPRSYGEGPLAFVIYNIPTGDPLPWIHLFFPRSNFDEINEKDGWIFGRKGAGYIGVWLPEGYQWITRGLWTDREVRSFKPMNAILVYVGHAPVQGNFDGFMKSTTKLNPKWDVSTLTLSARSMVDQTLVQVNYRYGPYRNGQPVPTQFARFETPWGSMPLGSYRLTLENEGYSYELDLCEPLAPTASRLKGFYRFQRVKRFLQRQRYLCAEPLVRLLRPRYFRWKIKHMNRSFI